LDKEQRFSGSAVAATLQSLEDCECRHSSALFGFSIKTFTILLLFNKTQKISFSLAFEAAFLSMRASPD
jgi:hypothetical protein